MPVGTGALMGAETGASAGAALGPIGMAAGGALGALAGGISGAPSYAQQQQKKLLKKDTKDYKAGKLGLSPAEKRQIVADRMQQVGSGIGAEQRNIAQDSLSATGTRDVGKYAAASNALGQQVQEGAAAAGRDAMQADIQQQAARRAEILGRLDTGAAQAQQKQALAHQQLVDTIKGAGTMGEMFAGNNPQWFADLMNGNYKKAFGLGGGSDAASAANLAAATPADTNFAPSRPV